MPGKAQRPVRLGLQASRDGWMALLCFGWTAGDHVVCLTLPERHHAVLAMSETSSNSLTQRWLRPLFGCHHQDPHKERGTSL